MNVRREKTMWLQVFVTAVVVGCGSCTSVKSEADEKMIRFMDSITALTDATRSCRTSESVLAVRDALLSVNSVSQCNASIGQNLAETLGQLKSLMQALLERMPTYQADDKYELERLSTLAQITKDYETTLNHTSQTFTTQLSHLVEAYSKQLNLNQKEMDAKLEEAMQKSAVHLDQAKQNCAAQISEKEKQLQMKITRLDQTSLAAQQQLKDELDVVKTQLGVFQQRISGREKAMDVLEDNIQQLRSQLQEVQKGKGCPSPFMKIDGDCIFVHRESKKNWSAARKFCAKLGGDLAVPSDVLQLRQFLIDFAGKDTYWVGGSDTAREGTWKYVNGKSVSLSTGWIRGQPDNYKNAEDCLAYWDKHDMFLNDFPCTMSLHFICQTFNLV